MRQPPVVQVEKPSLLEQLLFRTWDLTLNAALVIVLLHFLLASGDLFLRKLIRVLPRFEDKKRVVYISREIETSISRYLVTQALINAGLGTAGGIAFWLLGMPDPVLWGVLGAVLNFIPFVGAATTIGVVFAVASASFPTLKQSLLPPLAYLVLGVLEGSVISPYIQGRRLLLNPVVLFMGLTFWGWLWGIAGALLAVPMLVMLKIFCDHIEPLSPIAEFLGGE
jgi:predicted PurR-regulated permease PerM